MTKKCVQCNKIKSLDNFYERKISKDGYRGECKQCSKSRVNKYNNKNKKLCPQCNQACWCKNGVCHKCKRQNNYDNYAKLKLGDKTYTQHKYAKYAYVRYWARQIAMDLGWNKCSKCGYDKHFEVCHIKPISSFSPDTLLIEINDVSNLIALCPNCHWEFDHDK